MRPTTDGEKAALSIWSQQWPRLRRNFRFCTFTAGDRSIDNASFDLQMLPSRDRSVRSRFAAVLDAAAMTVKDDEWLDDAVSDLLLPGRTDLRSFLRKVGAALERGRDGFLSLC